MNSCLTTAPVPLNTMESCEIFQLTSSFKDRLQQFKNRFSLDYLHLMIKATLRLYWHHHPDGIIRNSCSEAFKVSLPPLFVMASLDLGKKVASLKKTVSSEKSHAHLGDNIWTGFEKVVGRKRNTF